MNPSCVTAPRATINGSITNCANGHPLQNAIVTTPDGFIRQSSASGQFSITVTPGTYTVNVSGPPGLGFGNCSQMVTVAANGTATVNCCLAGVPIIVSAGATLVSESCTPANGVLDPNETVTLSLCVQNTGGANTTALMGTLQATGGVTNIQAPNPQDYGVVVAGGPAVCRNFTFTVNGTCGGTVTATLNLIDGATDLGSVTYTFTIGVLNTAFTENFDGVTAPALPAGWSATQGTNVTGAPLWVTSTTSPDTAPNDAFSTCPSNILVNRLDTPVIAISTAAAQVSFRNNFDFNDTGGGFDGGVLEVSSPNINAGAFTDITAAAVGGSFVQNGYNRTISVNFASPIAGRMAWSGPSGGYVTTIANLGPNVAGQSIKLRWRAAADNSVASGGWRIDTVKVTDGFVCATQCAVATCTAITCPANITQSNDPNQCGAVTTYSAPTPVGTGCGTITCSPPSGSFFPKGTTTVTCTSTAGPTCTFTVTINDTQEPTITCPPNVTAVGNQSCAAQGSCTIVNFPPPTANDNCPGVTVACVPPSGSCLPAGTTTVTCTATDTSGNTATCSFNVVTFDARIQDDAVSTNVLLFNTTTGEYRFFCNGTVFTGVGKVTRAGCIFTLSHLAIQQRVQATLNKSTNNGTASLQAPPGTNRCTLTDRNTLDDTALCQ